MHSPNACNMHTFARFFLMIPAKGCVLPNPDSELSFAAFPPIKSYLLLASSLLQLLHQYATNIAFPRQYLTS